MGFFDYLFVISMENKKMAAFKSQNRSKNFISFHFKAKIKNTEKVSTRRKSQILP
jgi:hypothetical protein